MVNKEDETLGDELNKPFDTPKPDEQRATSGTIKVKPRKERSDKGKKRKAIESEIDTPTTSEYETSESVVELITDYLASRQGYEHFKAEPDEIKKIGKALADLLKKYIPFMDKYKEEFAFGSLAGSYILTRTVMKK